jgi:hypothetical protein
MALIFRLAVLLLPSRHDAKRVVRQRTLER